MNMARFTLSLTHALAEYGQLGNAIDGVRRALSRRTGVPAIAYPAEPGNGFG
jgi:hypothetical protein